LPRGLCCIAETAPSEKIALPARLAGHAVLPALTLIPPPRDATVSGKFLGPTRRMAPGSSPGFAGIRPPFPGQPIQGVSGFAATRGDDGSVFAISDNGFGRKATSSDVLLTIHRILPVFDDGIIDVKETIFLSDPNFRVPFRITYEGTETRYLTGADLDPESVQIVDGSFWFEDEFVPWLVRADRAGRIEDVYPAVLDGTALRSPDHPRVDALSVRGHDWQIGRSKGFEGLALNPGTGMLWAMLEAPLTGSDSTPRSDVPALEFDLRAGAWTGRRMNFRLGPGATAVGDFHFGDGRFALVIERDAGNGRAATSCDGSIPPPYHRNPARVKRIVIVDAAPVADTDTMARIATIDLMDIADTGNVALPERPVADRAFTFPFVTFEAVTTWDNRHLVVGNDNNLPSQDGREPAAATPTEIIRIDIGGALPELLDEPPILLFLLPNLYLKESEPRLPRAFSGRSPRNRNHRATPISPARPCT
jgi:hypothetical protein